jgi:hypothetical protein
LCFFFGVAVVVVTFVVVMVIAIVSQRRLFWLHCRVECVAVVVVAVVVVVAGVVVTAERVLRLRAAPVSTLSPSPPALGVASLLHDAVLALVRCVNRSSCASL